MLRLYFGLDGGREHTLEEIGGMLGVTRERVRQLRDRALKRLREGEVGRALASLRMKRGVAARVLAGRFSSIATRCPLPLHIPSHCRSPHPPPTREGFIAHLGRRSIEAGRALADVRTWLPLLANQMRLLGVDSVPIALFIAVFTGIVLSLLSSYIFTGTVPLYFVGALVGKTIMMELGPVLTGMALAGRVGASIAAELGTMKVTEQVDALETLAYDRYAYLVVPRVLAAILMFPVVTAFAMGGGRGLGLDHLHQPAGSLQSRVLQGAEAVLPLQGHLVRPGQERQLRRRRGPDGMPARPGR